MNARAISAVSMLIIFTAAHVESAAELIRKLPNADYLRRCYRVPSGVALSVHGPVFPPDLSKDAKEALEKKLEEYHKNIAGLSGQFRKLKSLLKPGTCVFDYPGLLAKGTISYDETKKTYRMMLGVYDRIRHAGSQGRFGPYFVAFDGAGKILSVEDVVYPD